MKLCSNDKHAVKRLPFLIRYVPDQYKTQEMCDKAVLENSETFRSVPDCNKSTTVIKLSTITLLKITLVPKCYKTQEMW